MSKTRSQAARDQPFLFLQERKRTACGNERTQPPSFDFSPLNPRLGMRRVDLQWPFRGRLTAYNCRTKLRATAAAAPPSPYPWLLSAALSRCLGLGSGGRTILASSGNPSTLVPILLASASAYAPFRRRGRARSRPLPATHWSTGSLAGTALEQLTQRQRMCRYHRLVAELLVPLELYARLRTHTATRTNEANGAG